MLQRMIISLLLEYIIPHMLIKEQNFLDNLYLHYTINGKISQFATSEIYDDENDKYYEIDNEFYPKSLLLHQNKSINFKCLNQNKKIKIILFWTKYYGYRFKFIFL